VKEMNDENVDEALKADESQIVEESPASEEVPTEPEGETTETESTEDVEVEAEPEGEGRKTANSRIRELVAEKKIAEEKALEERTKAESLEDQMRKFTAQNVPSYQPTMTPAEGEELTVENVLRQADAIAQIRVAQANNLNRIQAEAQEAIKKYPELDPQSDSFDADLSEAVSKATLAQVNSYPTSSVKEFVDSLIKPYRRSVDKQVAGQKETIAKQVSQQATRPTQVQEQEKPFSELSIEEMEKKLGVVYR
jgi:hypothetical protein